MRCLFSLLLLFAVNDPLLAAQPKAELLWP